MKKNYMHAVNSVGKAVLVLSTILLFSMGLQAQVTVGLGEAPVAGAALQIKTIEGNNNATSTLGLGLPRVILTDLNELYPMFAPGYNKTTEDPKHAGLLVFNINDTDFDKAVYVWDGSNWGKVEGGGGGGGTPQIPGNITFSCAGLSTIYVGMGTTVNEQVTIAYTASVGNGYLPDGLVLSSANGLTLSVSGYNSIATGGGNISLKLTGSPAKVEATLLNINIGGSTCTITVVVTTSIYSDCGAYVAPGVWKAFLCHNLGADDSIKPIPENTSEAVRGLDGAKYKFGAKFASITMAEDQALHGAIYGWIARPYQSTGNWTADNNPCPPGFRVPTQAEWTGVITLSYNSQSSIGNWANSPTNYGSGTYFGSKLFLPATGYRRDFDGELANRNYVGYYWSSTEATSSTGHTMDIRNNISSMNSMTRTSGLSVRCIAE